MTQETATPWITAEEFYGMRLIPDRVPSRSHPHIHFCTDEQGARLVFKRHWFLSDEERIMAIEELIIAVAQAGVAPAVQRSSAGKLFMNYEGQVYSLMERIETMPFNVALHLEAVARTVAQMHKALARIDGALLAPLFISPARAYELLERHGLPVPREFLLSVLKDDYSPTGAAHNDLHAGNIVVDSAGRPWILDYDGCGANPLMEDVMFAAFRLTGGNRDKIERFAEAYRAEHPPSNDQWRRRYHILLRDFMMKIAFILERQAQGEDRYLKDLHRYEAFVARAMALIEERTP